jgi:DNA-binding protein H-NS
MNPELNAAKQALEAAQANYQKMLNDAKIEQIAIIKQIMQDYGITVDDLTGKPTQTKEPKTESIKYKAGVYQDSNGNEITYNGKGRPPKSIIGTTFLRDI